MDYNNDIIIHREEEDSLDSMYDSIVGVQSHEMIEDGDFASISNGNGSCEDESHETPNGTRFWRPDHVPEDFKPVFESVWADPEDALAMYKTYAEKAGFDVRRGSVKRINGVLTHKYFLCHKAGEPKKKNVADTLVNDDNDTGRLQRNSNYKVTNCMARIKLKLLKGTESYQLYEFVEAHNHPLIDDNHSHLSRARRQLTFDDKVFIQSVSTNNIGATKAHRLRAALKGGYDKVRGTVTDFKNWKAKLNMFIGDRDAQMVVDKFRNRKVCLPEFSFDYKCDNNELIGLFWADETMKCNYKEFGDVMCFDATYKTNKYCMVFVPFTGIDNHNRCVTFGAGLLKNENIESYSWLLNVFLKSHNRQPRLVLTDQDPAMFEAVSTVMNESHHRLCMWHIMKKLPLKQRHAQGSLDDHTSRTTARMISPLAIERFAANVYTRSIFFKVQKEIFKGAWVGSQQLVQSDDANEVFQVNHSLTASKAHLKYKVIRNKDDGSITCSCNLFGRHGYLCRHIFCVLKSKNVDVIPDQYIMRRWRRNVLPRHLSDKQHRYVNKHAQVDEISSQAISGLEMCFSRLRHDPVMFASFVDKVNKLSESTLSELPRADPVVDDEQVFMDLLGVTVPEKCDVFAPKDINNKGSGSNTKGSGSNSGKRFPDPGEKHVNKRKRQMRKCAYCKEVQDNHDIRNCEIKKRDEDEARAAAKRA